MDRNGEYETMERTQITVKDKSIFTSKKFAAFFLGLVTLTTDLWMVLETPELTAVQAGVAWVVAAGTVVLCLGYVLPQAKFDSAMVSLFKGGESND